MKIIMRLMVIYGNYKMKIYLICPVRLATDKNKEYLNAYVDYLEKEGNDVYYPARDNPYEKIDKVGDMICKANEFAIVWSDEVHIYWIEESTGSKFDLGLTFAHQKPIVILNDIKVEIRDKPSFKNLLNSWPFGVEQVQWWRG